MSPVLKAIVRRGLQLHLPVNRLTKPVFAVLYRLHVLVREMWLWTLRVMWAEPLFRSQCERVGTRFEMEQLPYMVGRGCIRIGSGVRLSGKSSIAFSSKHGGAVLEIGDQTFIGHNCSIAVAKAVSIGRDCLIAGGVRIADFDGHPLDAEERRKGLPTPIEAVHPVCIGDDVWIGQGALVLKGVRIGNRSVIGARAVVTRDVPDDCVVVGNPARVVKSISSPLRNAS
ncbi:DapH/DapD/GlmU-related protein [Neorhodopirellula lusitana]|uniref:DapH/DapD/GlmU-related protein n=1 Tax=Neorhodopirellula lusitana TaxID=445327 RepID=UPI00384BC0CD